MFDLIDFRRRTPLEWLPVEARDASYVMIHKHHIVPRAWFKVNKLPVDNSKENLVNLTILEHI